MKGFVFGVGVLLALATGCGGTSKESSSGGMNAGATADIVPVSCDQKTPDASVAIENSAFTPKSLTINVGDVVRWTNLDSLTHTVTSGVPGGADAGDTFDSGDIAPGESFCFQFQTASSFRYFCRHHPDVMRGTVVVRE